MTASFGVSGWLATDKDREAILRRADNALYEAKNKGRDCVVLHDGGLIHG
jgi:PleD family two-component response regulator